MIVPPKSAILEPTQKSNHPMIMCASLIPSGANPSITSAGYYRSQDLKSHAGQSKPSRPLIVVPAMLYLPKQ